MKTWAAIADDFNDGLVLGNGASIAFDQRFSYGSLRETAQETDLISENVNKVFAHLETDDFEFVLRMLWHASMINQALDIPDSRTTEAYESVREALIKVVGAIHVSYEDVVIDRLPAAAGFMSRFSTVASLNYDLLVYWALMHDNADGTIRFKDCFVNGRFDSDCYRFREPLGENPTPTLIFYPHGNLALAADVHGVETKLQATDNANLLATIFAQWRSGDMAPVFVSEGLPQQKMASIRRSPYLSTVYEDILPDLG